MGDFNKTAHWDHVYQTKPLESVSWYQPVPKTSIQLIHELELPFSAKIIDIGGGDSLLVDHLLEMGYEDITVLDISLAAINRAKERLGHAAERIQWIVADVCDFRPNATYDLWHDRAAFHFLTEEKDIASYVEASQRTIAEDGKMILGTFSDKGPEKCSGLPIKQYTADLLETTFSPAFRKEKCFHEQHPTPNGSFQDFVFCRFAKK